MRSRSHGGTPASWKRFFSVRRGRRASGCKRSPPERSCTAERLPSTTWHRCRRRAPCESAARRRAPAARARARRAMRTARIGRCLRRPLDATRAAIHAQRARHRARSACARRRAPSCFSISTSFASLGARRPFAARNSRSRLRRISFAAPRNAAPRARAPRASADSAGEQRRDAQADEVARKASDALLSSSIQSSACSRA